MARILIAEDSPDIRALVELLLAAEGHQISSVTDGRAAVETATTQPLDGGPPGPGHRRRGKGTWILVTAGLVAAALVAGGLILSARNDGNGSGGSGRSAGRSTSWKCLPT